MKSYTTISLTPAKKEKLKIVKKDDGTYGQAIEELIEKADLDEETKQKFEEIEEEYEGDN